MFAGLFGGMLGGASQPQSQPRTRDIPDRNPLDELCGGLFGSGINVQKPRQQPQPPEQRGEVDVIVSSPLGEAVLAGLAAFAMKEMMDKMAGCSASCVEPITAGAHVRLRGSWMRGDTRAGAAEYGAARYRLDP